MDTKYYDKTVQWRSGFSSTAVFSTPLVHYPMPASHIYLSNGATEKDKGYEGWLASKQSIYAPERAFMEAGSNEKVFHAGEATQGYSNMRRAPREVEEIMIIRNPALSAVVYDDVKVFPAAEATNGYPHMRQAVKGKDENTFGRNMMSSEGDQSSNKISSAEAIYEFLNMRQAARWKEENKPASNSALSDSEYGRNTYSPRAGKMDQEARQKEHVPGSSPFLGDDGHNRDTYSPRAGRGHMNMTMDQEPRQKEHVRGSSPFLGDDGHNRDTYSPRAGRGHMNMKMDQEPRQKEHVRGSSPFLSDDGHNRNTYSPRVGRGHMNMKMDQEPRQKEHVRGLSPFLGDDGHNRDTYSPRAGRGHLNMKMDQEPRQKEHVRGSSPFLGDDGHNRDTYSPRASRGHMTMKMDQEPRQKDYSRGSNPFLSDDGHNRDMYPAEAGRGYTIIRQGPSSVLDDDEYHKMYSPEAGREYTIVTKTTRKKVEAVFALNPVLCDDDDDDEYGHMVFVKPPIMESTNKRKAVACGPWGGSSGDLFDDGVFTGIREIELTRTGCIISIKVCYDMDGKAVWGNRNGGDHGIKVDKIVLDYPSEYLTHISGYYGSTVLRGPTVIKSLTFHTNRRKFGPFGDQQGVSFSSAGSVEGRIVGFSGRTKGWYVTSIGVHVMEGKPPQPAHDLLNLIGMRMCEAGTRREPDQWYAKKVYMKMVNK